MSIFALVWAITKVQVEHHMRKNHGAEKENRSAHGDVQSCQRQELTASKQRQEGFWNLIQAGRFGP